MSLRTLDPAPAVLRGAVSFLATAGGRTEDGVRALVQVGTEAPRAADAVLLSSSEARRRFAAQVGEAVAVPPPVAEGALLELLGLVEAALRGMPEDEPWAPPVPLGVPVLPPFPTAALPSWVRAQVEGVAAAVQVPPDLPAMLALSGLSLCVARRVVVSPQPGWGEPLNLYTMAVLASGNRKSAAFSLMLAPFEAWEEAEKARCAEAIAAAQSRQRTLEGAVHRAEAAAAKAGGAERAALTAEAQELAKELRALRVPAEPRLLADDVTSERLGQLLSEQEGRIGVFAPEGDVLDLMAGRYGDGLPNIGVYLRGHSGDTHRVDRLNRPAEYVRRPAIAIGICVQPEVLAGLKARPTFHGRGLLARFLYALPASLLGSRGIGAPALPRAVGEDYARQIRELLSLDPPLDERGRLGAHTLVFTPAARERFDGFRQRAERMLAPDGDLAPMGDWGGKFAGSVARVIGLLHLAAVSEEYRPWAIPIADCTVEAGMAIGDYLLAHARAAFAEMGADPAAAGAGLILEWTRRERHEQFSKRDAWRALRGRFGRAADLDGPLGMLVEHGQLREQERGQQPGRGRRPSQVYLVNPVCIPGHKGHKGHNGRNAAECRAPEECAPTDGDAAGAEGDTRPGQKWPQIGHAPHSGQSDQSRSAPQKPPHQEESNSGHPGRPFGRPDHVQLDELSQAIIAGDALGRPAS